MKKTILVMMVLAMILAVPLQIASAATTKYNLTVINHVNDKVFVTLTSKEKDDDDEDEIKTYTITVDRFEESTKELPKGMYGYDYEVCGAHYSGKVELKKDAEIEILPCGVEPTKMRFNSHFAQTITVSMYGPLEMPEPEETEFTIELGGNRISDILSGNYILSYEVDCGTTEFGTATLFTDEVRVRKNGTTAVTLHGCEWHDHPARIYDKPVPVKFRIVNHASFPIVLQIVGPQGALLDINPGVNLVNLIYGTYKYGYFLDGTYHTGNMMVTKNGLGTLVLRPSHIFELPTSGGADDSGE